MTTKTETFRPTSLLESHGLIETTKTRAEQNKEIAALLKKAAKLNAKWEKANKA